MASGSSTAALLSTGTKRAAERGSSSTTRRSWIGWGQADARCSMQFGGAVLVELAEVEVGVAEGVEDNCCREQRRRRRVPAAAFPGVVDEEDGGVGVAERGERSPSRMTDIIGSGSFLSARCRADAGVEEQVSGLGLVDGGAQPWLPIGEPDGRLDDDVEGEPIEVEAARGASARRRRSTMTACRSSAQRRVTRPLLGDDEAAGAGGSGGDGDAEVEGEEALAALLERCRGCAAPCPGGRVGVGEPGERGGGGRRAPRRAWWRRVPGGPSAVLHVEDGGLDVGGFDVLAGGGGGGEQTAGGEGVDLARHAAAVLEELVEGGCGSGLLAALDGAEASLDVLDRSRDRWSAARARSGWGRAARGEREGWDRRGGRAEVGCPARTMVKGEGADRSRCWRASEARRGLWRRRGVASSRTRISVFIGAGELVEDGLQAVCAGGALGLVSCRSGWRAVR